MSYTRSKMREHRTTLVLVVMLGLLLGAWGPRFAGAGVPANKVAVAGSRTEVFGPGVKVALLTDVVKTSKPTDLVLQVTAECDIVTDVTTLGNDDQQAFGQVRVWVEIDGAPVLVDGAAGDGKVVFCNRLHRSVTNFFQDETPAIRTFLDTRTANGFNWIALNTGSATHSIAVYAELTTNATARANALAVVGQRTLVIEPVKAAQYETLN